MKLKWLFWTGLLATVVFFGAIYFGMKYNWISGSQSDSAKSKPAAVKPFKQNPEISQVNTSSNMTRISSSLGNGVDPELIDEIETTGDQRTLDTLDLTIEEVVSQCQSLSQSIGVPEQSMEQAVSECVDRNSQHLTTEDNSLDERGALIREQCNIAITQKDLLSSEEIKMLVDECVASMSQN